MALIIFVFIVAGFYLLTYKKMDYSDQSPTFEEIDRINAKNKIHGN